MAQKGEGVRADKLTTIAIASGALGLLLSVPTLVDAGLLRWTIESLYICSFLSVLIHFFKRSRSQRRLLADLQEHEAALHPEAAGAPRDSVEAATRAIVDSAERIVSRASARSIELEAQVRELELKLAMAQSALQEIESALSGMDDTVWQPGPALSLRASRPFDIDLTTSYPAPATVGRGVAMWPDLNRKKELAEIKTAFVSRVSHELRTPLASIKAYIEMLIDGEAADAATQKQFYEIIQNEANRLGKLIDGTLHAPA